MNGPGFVPSATLDRRMRWCCHFGILNRSLVGQVHGTFVLQKHQKAAAGICSSRPLEGGRLRKRWLTIAKSSQRASDLGSPQRWIPGRVLRFTNDTAISCDSKPRVWPIRHLSDDGCAAHRSSNHSTEVATNDGELTNANKFSNLSQKAVVQPSISKVTRTGATRLACPGCGVYMQDKNPKAPGFFKRPAFLDESLTEEAECLSEADEALNEEEDELEDDDDEEEVVDDSEISSSQEWQGNNWVLKSGKWEEIEKAQVQDEINGFKPAGPGYGSWNEVGPSSEDAKNAWNDELNLKVKSKTGAKKAKEEGERLVVCARCHSLRSYGQVKDESVENLLPEFDFEQAVGSRLLKAYGRRAVVVMVIDSVDFDGSFPRRVAALLAEADKKFASAWKGGASGNVPRLIVAGTKVDLLPGQVSPVRLEHWVRRRVVDGGAPRPSGVHLVSSKKGWGLQALADQITRLSGPRGDVWVVGAQNAGKSSLINALGKLAGLKNKPSAQLTEAPVPGTTVGILKLEGILPARARLYDTPGILHPHQITTRLSRDEQKLVQARKELKPRTFRVKVGNTVHVGGLLRLDIVKTPTESIYITIWTSPLVPCHLGKTEKADETLEKHLGERLQPPLEKKRLPELGKWLPRIVQVSGDNWTASSVDVAVAGLGWVAVALKGDATLSVWTYEGIAITRHEAMVHDMATVFEKPGFTVDKGPTKTEGKSGSLLTKKPIKKVQIN